MDTADYEAVIQMVRDVNFNEMKSHPECSYCGIRNTRCLIKCYACKKWFCNWKGKTKISHIVAHLRQSNHNEVTLHQDGLLGEMGFRCSLCSCQNVFMLGYVDNHISPSTKWFCRLPCSLKADGISDDAKLYADNWKPIITEHMFSDMAVSDPSLEEQRNARTITGYQTIQLEELWAANENANITDVQPAIPELERVTLRYTTAHKYKQMFAALVKLEADYDKMKTKKNHSVTEVRWEIRSDRVNAYITLMKLEGLHLARGSLLSLKCNGGISIDKDKPWSGIGYVFKVPKNLDRVVGITLDNGLNAPVGITRGFTVSSMYNPTPYFRMQNALMKFATDETAVSVYVFRRLLGHEVEDVRFTCGLPRDCSAPNLPTLNSSQDAAVRKALQQPISLIQGPPGTGKTVTSASLVYHLAEQNNGQILVCAPSNTAVDHLAEKIHLTGLKVVRICSRSREAINSPLPQLTLHNKLNDVNTDATLHKYQIMLKSSIKLSTEDQAEYKSLLNSCTRKILTAAQVICCTCATAGDVRLDEFKFNTVLIDESTQASEPECMIPIVKGVKQLILVGDHCQLGPVIMCKKASKFGLSTTLFQRFLVQGSRPFVLNRQYRMHPELSKFPSKLFYEGTLKDGISAKERKMKGVGFPWPSEKPMFFYTISGSEEISGSGISFLNRVEASLVEMLVARLISCGVKSDQIGIITPYDGQKSHILEYMKYCRSLDPMHYQDLEVSCVDGFQGREKDFIILSCVRSNQSSSVGFLNDPRRLNVAITRARYGLIILGDAKVLSKHPLWNHLLTYYKEQNVLVEGPLDNLNNADINLDSPPELVNKINPNNHFMNLVDYETCATIVPGDI